MLSLKSLGLGVTATILFVLVAGADTACDGSTSADKAQQEATAVAMQEAHKQVGMPDITRFTEKKMLRDLYELRDQEDLTTWTYIVDMNGKLHLLGRSIGFGLPASVQFSNPERILRGSGGTYYGTMPQPEPSGLFMPTGLSATWVMLIDEGTNKARPVYVEPTIIVSPFELKVN